MILLPILSVALLPQRGETDLSDILKIVILLLLPVLLGVGKTIMDKVKGKEAARVKRQRHPGQTPFTVAASTEPDPIDREDPASFWDELVTQATGGAPEAGMGTSASPALQELPPSVERLTAAELEEVGGLPSTHLEDYLESHPHVDLVEQRERDDPSRRGYLDLPPLARASRGFALRESIARGGGWKQAIVVAEVLGSPLGLRSREGPPGSR